MSTKTAANSKTSKSAFLSHEAQTQDDVMLAVWDNRDFTAVGTIYGEYGSFLSRHPEAFKLLPDPGRPDPRETVIVATPRERAGLVEFVSEPTSDEH